MGIGVRSHKKLFDLEHTSDVGLLNQNPDMQFFSTLHDNVSMFSLLLAPKCKVRLQGWIALKSESFLKEEKPNEVHKLFL